MSGIDTLERTATKTQPPQRWRNRFLVRALKPGRFAWWSATCPCGFEAQYFAGDQFSDHCETYPTEAEAIAAAKSDLKGVKGIVFVGARPEPAP